MISISIFLVVLIVGFILFVYGLESSYSYKESFLISVLWIFWALFNLLWIIPIFTGINVKNGEGQLKGYITAVEKNGTFFVGYNAYIKSDLTSSNEDVACIDRDNKDLIDELKKALENKENIVVEYESVWQYAIGECPGSNFKIIRIIK